MNPLLESLSRNAWRNYQECNDSSEARDLLKQFIKTYGVEAFCIHLDQETIRDHGKTFTYAEKLIYLSRLIGSKINFK